MILAVLSACLAADPQVCAPVTLVGQPYATLAECDNDALRIASDWLVERSDLQDGGLTCTDLDDLPALAVDQVADGVHVHIGQVAQFEDSPDGWIANLGFVVGDNSIAVIDAGASRLLMLKRASRRAQATA